MKVVKISKNVATGGKIFKVNEEYALVDSIVKKQSCGCKEGTTLKVTYYRINVDGKTYDIHNGSATLIEKSMVDNIISPQDFHTTLHGTTINDNRDYDLIRNKPSISEIMERVNNIPM